MDDDWIAADLEILDSILHCDEIFTSAKKVKSHKKEQQSINHQISITSENLLLIVKLNREFLKKLKLNCRKICWKTSRNHSTN